MKVIANMSRALPFKKSRFNSYRSCHFCVSLKECFVYIVLLFNFLIGQKIFLNPSFDAPH